LQEIERKRKESIERKKEERKKLIEMEKKLEKERKEEEQRKKSKEEQLRLQQEQKNREKEHAIKFPDGIASLGEKKTQEKVKFIHLDEKLKNSIINEPITSLSLMICKENSITIDGLSRKIIDPEEEPYYNVFDDYKILVVILYLGNKEHDKDITTKIFEENTGKELRKKGFKLDIVYSYGKAIQKISTLENGNCPYSEIWIFCSKGDGTLPEKAEDKDSNKITIFLQMVADFNKKGGALFLFCENFPFVLEANLLIKEYIQFEEGNINFEMRGNYKNEKNEEKFIYVKDDKNSKNGFFEPETFLKSPGKADIRLSLRIGLNRFSEGTTPSNAETFDGSENYSPFTPFAYLTDQRKKRPFILYYDPKVEIGRGPIVIHGGFTSAFYDFNEEGTGRLVISIACWLIRKEEILMNLASGIVKTIPPIKIPKIKNNLPFDKWIKNGSMYSILILDVSGSMKKYYKPLCEMANEIIKNLNKNNENEGVIILFGKEAKTVMNGKLELLDFDKYKDLPNITNGTNFLNAFKEAKKHIYNKDKFNYKRILFLTDGKDYNSNIKIICQEMVKEDFEINIIGFKSNDKDKANFEHLRQYASKDRFFTSNSFKEVENYCINIFAAE